VSRSSAADLPVAVRRECEAAAVAYERTIDIGIIEGVLVRFSQSGRPIEAAFHGGPTNEAIPAAIDHLKGPLGSDNRVMEKLARSENTGGTDAAFDLLGRIAVDPESNERYPDGTVLIPADSPDASGLMSRAIDERKPVAVVFPDGSDVVARPPAASGPALLVVIGLLWLADHLRRKRDRPTFVPREWVMEFHAAHTSNESKLTA
jgi:hypothetical protein